MAKAHLVILKKPYLDAILAGRKTIESRLTMTRREPLGQIAVGEKLFFKVTSGEVLATGRVKKVREFEDLTPRRIKRIQSEYDSRILGGDTYWAVKSNCRFCVLIWIGAVKTIKPRRINKKDFRAWVVLTEGNDFGLLSVR